jgi:hypothetical protein
MSTTDKTLVLARSNARRHDAALTAARDAIGHIQGEGGTLNFGTVAAAAGVSRSWLYRQPEIRELISQLRIAPPRLPARRPQRASTDSMRQMLEALRAELSRVRDENRVLRDQLARNLGAQRVKGGSHANAFGGDMSTPSTPTSTRASSG